MVGRTFRPTASTAGVAIWRCAVLPIPGARPISVGLSSDRRGCVALASAMLGVDEDELELAMIDDFLRELLNMTAGQIRSELALDQALGLPRVVDVDDPFRSSAWTHHVLDDSNVQLMVSLANKVF
jgi:hypothetical protein